MAKVFISCGQRPGEEENTAKQIKNWIDKQTGYSAWLARDAQSLEDLNNSIIKNLVDSDYFLFIDFKREKINGEFRGSLYSHQELVLAHYLGFPEEESLFLAQEGLKLEGFAEHLLFNCERFKEYKDIMRIVKDEIPKKWKPDYSRSLIVDKDSIGKPCIGKYKDHLQPFRRESIWGCRINNKRKKSANNVKIVLRRIKYPNGAVYNSSDTAYLKWGGHRDCYAIDIPSGQSENIDLFSIPTSLFGIPLDNPSKVYLHSNTDISPRKPVVDKPGIYYLYYKISADEFPTVVFSVKLVLNADWGKAKADIDKCKTDLPETTSDNSSKYLSAKMVKDTSSGIGSRNNF